MIEAANSVVIHVLIRLLQTPNMFHMKYAGTFLAAFALLAGQLGLRVLGISLDRHHAAMVGFD
jgi:hypothetical protein